MNKFTFKKIANLEVLFFFWISFGFIVAYLVRSGFASQHFKIISNWVSDNVYAIKLSPAGYYFGDEVAFQIAHSIFSATPLIVLSFFFVPCSEIEEKFHKKPTSNPAFAQLLLAVICIESIFFGYSMRGPNKIFLRNEYAFSFLSSICTVVFSYAIRHFSCLIRRK